MHVQFELEAFVSWLCLHDGNEVVGYVGTWFDSPLARYLSEVTGHLFGVDSQRYGCALDDYQRWLVLPCWAQHLSWWVESCPRRPTTGDEVLEVLASIERVLRQKGNLPV
jgi:hypothetical protein